MIKILHDFITAHPEGFTDTQLMQAIPEALWSQATRELYALTLIDKTIHYDFATELFIDRRIDGAK